MKTMPVLLLCLSGIVETAAHAQTKPVTPGGPVVPALPIADDPVARAMAQQAMTAADAPVISKTIVVGGPGAVPITDPTGTLGGGAIQVNGNQPNNVGFMAFKYGNDAKGITNYWIKSRGVAPNTYTGVQLGDRILSDNWQVGTGGQTGHAGYIQIIVDSANYTAGEVAGRWSLMTGTGIAASTASKQYPNRYGSMEAIVANSYQQVLFPGGVNDTTPGPGTNFGGWVVIGAGGASPGFGALKFISSNAALLTTPEPGAFEVDAGAKPYFTAADGVRRSVVLADTAAPTVRALGQAGSGATARIDANGNSGVVTLITGAGAGTGDLFTVTYAHPYPAASYPVVSAANAAAVALVRGGYLTATPAGFTLSLPAGTSAAAGTTYVITYGVGGR